MNNGKAVENQKEDKKAFGKFIVFIILSALAGAAVGIGAVKMQKYGFLDTLGKSLMFAHTHIAPFGTLIFTTALFVWASVTEKRCRRMYAGWNGEDEEVYHHIEWNLCCILTASSLNLILSYFFFGAGFYGIQDEDYYQLFTAVRIAASLGGLIYMMIVVTVIQKRVINFEKELNPEKNGSIYELQFKKKWMESCDEAEKLQIYKCAYKAYQTTGGACIALWLFCVIGMFFWGFGILPMTLVILIWLIMNLSYSIEAMRLAKHPEEIMK